MAQLSNSFWFLLVGLLNEAKEDEMIVVEDETFAVFKLDGGF